MIDFDGKKCTGCGVCAIACLDEKDTELKRMPLLRRVFQSEKIENGKIKINYKSTACMHCDNAPCLDACPFGCIIRDKDTNLVIQDGTKCTSCGRCADACPIDAISFDADGIFQKCDGCPARVKLGLMPVCVDSCPQKALTYHANHSMS